MKQIKRVTALLLALALAVCLSSCAQQPSDPAPDVNTEAQAPGSSDTGNASGNSETVGMENTTGNNPESTPENASAKQERSGGYAPTTEEEPEVYMDESVPGPKIPYGMNLSSYDPSQDGYYAYMTVRNLNNDEYHPAGELPLLIYGNIVLADAGLLGQLIPSLAVERDGERLILRAGGRTLTLTSGQLTARIRVTSTYYPVSSALIDRDVFLLGRPWLVDDRFWVPLADVVSLLGIRIIVIEEHYSDPEMLAFIEPERTVTDVLADLYSDPYLDSLKIRFSEENQDALTKMAVSAGLVLGMDSLTSPLDFFRRVKGTNIAPFIDQVAKVSQSEILERFTDSMDTAGNIASLLQDKDHTFFLLNDSAGMDVALLLLQGVSAVTLWESYEADFKNRDDIAIESLTWFMEHCSWEYMEEKLEKVVRKAVNSLQSSSDYATARAYPQFAERAGVTIVEELVNGFGSAAFKGTFSFLNWYDLAKGICARFMPGWKDTIDKMEAFEAMGYGILFQADAETALREALEPISRHAEGSGGIRDAERAAYLYLKACATNWENTLHALGRADSPSEDDQRTLDRIHRDLNILSGSYRPDAPSPIPGYDTFADASGLNRSLMARSVPLYMELSGSVINKEDRQPVEDARVRFYYGQELCGTVAGTPGGDLSAVFVPLLAPKELEVKTDDIPSVLFASPTVAGADRISAPFVPAGQDTLKTAELGAPEAVYGNDPANAIRRWGHTLIEDSPCYGDGRIYLRIHYKDSRLYSVKEDGSDIRLELKYDEDMYYTFTFLNYYQGSVYYFYMDQEEHAEIRRYDTEKRTNETVLKLEDNETLMSMHIVNDDLYYILTTESPRNLRIFQMSLITGETNLLYQNRNLGRCVLLGCYHGYLYFGTLDYYGYNSVMRCAVDMSKMNEYERELAVDLADSGSRMQVLLDRNYYLYYGMLLILAENGFGAIIEREKGEHGNGVDLVFFDYNDIRIDEDYNVIWPCTKYVDHDQIDWETVDYWLNRSYDLDGTLVMYYGKDLYYADTYDYTQAKYLSTPEHEGGVFKYRDQMFVYQYKVDYHTNTLESVYVYPPISF